MLMTKRYVIVVLLVSTFIWACGKKNPPPPGPKYSNNPPEITKITFSINKDELLSGETVRMYVEAQDPEKDTLKYKYKLDGDSIPGFGATCSTYFVAPSAEGEHTILIEVCDTANAPVESSIKITICNSTSFGIYSEGEHCRILLDQNSFLGMYSGGGAQAIEFKDDPNEKCEGGYSKKLTINVAPTGQWVGWFVMYGIKGTLDTLNRDLMLFDGGSLRFCIKSEIKNLIVSIRSGNVTAGTEHNVLLSDFSDFKVGEWCELSIPIVRFTDPPFGEKKADLRHLKILFNIASSQQSGGTNGTQSFWIDNVRLVRSGY